MLDLVIVQQGLRGEEDTAGLTVIRQGHIVLVILIVHFLLYGALLGFQRRRGCGRVDRVCRFRALQRRGFLRLVVLLHQVELREHYHRIIVFGKR